jgi:hypothetical protein
LERIRISVVKNLLGKSNKELRYGLSKAVSAKDKRIKSVRGLMEECKLLEDNNKQFLNQEII